MVAQEWSGRNLNSSVYFEPDEQGLDLFKSYLTSLNHEPVRLLVDLIEEEFRQIKIPLLSGQNRREIVNRNFAKFFRNSDYRLARSQARLKKERKEEVLLMMGLTNQFLLKPWLEIIDSTRTPLSGIVSLPLISESVVSQFKDEHDCVILVSQQVPSNLRQSVFIKGKLVLSRLVPIASFYQGDYANDVIRDVESTQRYLFSQRLIQRTDIVSVHIISNRHHLEQLRVRTSDDEYLDYAVHDINDLLESEKIEASEEQDFSSALFCYQASKSAYVNHYANPAEKKYFYHHVAAIGSKVLAVLLLSLTLGLFATSVVKAMLYESSIVEMESLEQKYRTKFNQLSVSRVDSSIKTTTMQSVVQTVEAIEQRYQLRPDDLMARVSQHLSLFNGLRVSSLDWFVARSPDTESASQVSWQAASSRSRSRNRRNTPQGNELYEVLVLSGRFVDFDGNYRFVLSAIDDLEDAMRVSGEYDKVEILQRPLNVGSEKKLSGDAGTRATKSKDIAEFALRVVRKVELSEK
jgi:hypothetical protein